MPRALCRKYKFIRKVRLQNFSVISSDLWHKFHSTYWDTKAGQRNVRILVRDLLLDVGSMGQNWLDCAVNILSNKRQVLHRPGPICTSPTSIECFFRVIQLVRLGTGECKDPIVLSIELSAWIKREKNASYFLNRSPRHCFYYLVLWYILWRFAFRGYTHVIAD